jgi:hypothetical protein
MYLNISVCNYHQPHLDSMVMWPLRRRVRHAPALVTQAHMPSAMSLLLSSLASEIPIVLCVYLCS